MWWPGTGDASAIKGRLKQGSGTILPYASPRIGCPVTAGLCEAALAKNAAN